MLFRSVVVGVRPDSDLAGGAGAMLGLKRAIAVDQEMRTNLSGVFAAGDVRSGSVKRVASSVGEGSVVISKVWEYVNR